MNSKLKVLKDKYFDWSMLRWMLVGFFTTATDYLLFISLYGPIDSVVIANFISGFIATSINYYTHHRWTLRASKIIQNLEPDFC
jgi:putative flippase GtrA